MEVGLIIVGVISLILAILSVIFITPRSRAPYLGSFGQWLHRILNFDSLLIEKILKFIYILLTVFAVLFGLFMLFAAIEYGGEMVLAGLGLMLLGPIALRLLFESMMMMVILVRNTVEINNKMGATGSGSTADHTVKPFDRVRVEEPVCPSCGARLKPGARFCGKCGRSTTTGTGTVPAKKDGGFLVPGSDDLL